MLLFANAETEDETVALNFYFVDISDEQRSERSNGTIGRG